MRVLISESTQTELINAIAKWKDNQSIGDYSVFIDTITFFPFYNGNVSAVVIYRDADNVGDAPITVHQQRQYAPPPSERSVFSAMQGGTDGG